MQCRRSKNERQRNVVTIPPSASRHHSDCFRSRPPSNDGLIENVWLRRRNRRTQAHAYCSRIATDLLGSADHTLSKINEQIPPILASKEKTAMDEWSIIDRTSGHNGGNDQGGVPDTMAESQAPGCPDFPRCIATPASECMREGVTHRPPTDHPYSATTQT